MHRAPRTSAAEELERSWARGRATWPGIEVERATFVDYLKARTSDDPDPEHPPLLELAVEELYLACACAAGDPKALTAFETVYFPTLDSALRRTGLGRVAIDDVKQDLRERLFLPDARGNCAITKFAGRGQLKAWLRVVAVRIANRRRASATEDVEDMVVSDGVAARDAELALVKDAYRGEFRRAFTVATQSLDGRARTILALHLLDGTSMQDISRIYNVHRTTVLRWLEQIFDSIRQRMRDELVNELAIGDDEYQSLLRLIASRIELSLGSALNAAPS